MLLLIMSRSLLQDVAGIRLAKHFRRTYRGVAFSLAKRLEAACQRCPMLCMVQVGPHVVGNRC
ncbi:hypothetical protein IF2G_00813 [Cordyceps javanica]|nr:hypothetical protein IF2G_00813 [Cordyceps javanica]